MAIVRKSAADIGRMLAEGESRSDWAAVDAIADADLDRLIVEDEDEGPAHLAIDWSQATTEPVWTKQMVNLRLDRDILDFFRRDGRGYQTRINAVLRSYVRHMTGAGSDQPRQRT
jgi:uncharacterized protein (DUF4415 family)